MEDDAEMAIRLVEERARIGFSQADFASKLGISREGLRKYEVGASRIPGPFLREAAALGLDVQYVITGVRSKNLEEVETRVTPAAVTVSGGAGNVIGIVHSGATVNQIHTQRHVTRTIAEVKPGTEHISEQQAAALTELVNEVVRLEGLTKREPKTHRAIWSALNAHCGVTRYRLIQASDFEKARRYLQQWIGRLSSTPTAQARDGDGLRRRRMAYIKINTRDRPEALADYLEKNFRVSGISELDEVELDRVYHWVASTRTKGR